MNLEDRLYIGEGALLPRYMIFCVVKNGVFLPHFFVFTTAYPAPVKALRGMW
ncbi:MAG: hypothetical protein J6F31_07805 [Oscillospiraceae bacterium]|nr:hypothetical protein [Oscillospiraceae bacterium]